MKYKLKRWWEKFKCFRTGGCEFAAKDRLPEMDQEVIVYAGNVLKPIVYCYHSACKRK